MGKLQKKFFEYKGKKYYLLDRVPIFSNNNCGLSKACKDSISVEDVNFILNGMQGSDYSFTSLDIEDYIEDVGMFEALEIIPNGRLLITLVSKYLDDLVNGVGNVFINPTPHNTAELYHRLITSYCSIIEDKIDYWGFDKQIKQECIYHASNGEVRHAPKTIKHLCYMIHFFDLLNVENKKIAYLDTKIEFVSRGVLKVKLYDHEQEITYNNVFLAIKLVLLDIVMKDPGFEPHTLLDVV